MLKQLVNKAIADPGGCGHSPADIVGSNPAGGIDSFSLVYCCVLSGRSLRRADHSSRGVLLTVMSRCV